MSGLPLNDWQFWTATIAVAFAAWFVVHTLMPRKKKGAKCPNCPTNQGASGAHKQRAKLTIDGLPPSNGITQNRL